ncbi:MAG: hypothetical protein Q9M92_16260 [Enterobacterales bacterium]|nr:hypothetical protein [Enterobacterales bacterium]
MVEHVDVQIKQCPSCDSTVKASFPAGLHGPLQYGDGLKKLCDQFASLSDGGT